MRRKFSPASFSFYWNMIHFPRGLIIPTIIFYLLLIFAFSGSTLHYIHAILLQPIYFYIFSFFTPLASVQHMCMWLPFFSTAIYFFFKQQQLKRAVTDLTIGTYNLFLTNLELSENVYFFLYHQNIAREEQLLF